MARSLKKGPYVDAHLLKKVEALNASGKKKLLKHGHAEALSSHNSSNIPSLSITDTNTLRFM